jgi:hypothetical protein
MHVINCINVLSINFLQTCRYHFALANNVIILLCIIGGITGMSLIITLHLKTE